METNTDAVPLLPCSLGATLVHSDEPFITLIMPDLVQRKAVYIGDIASFVHQHLPGASVSMCHVLLYLWALRPDPRIAGVNSFRLLHTGKLYGIQSLVDLVRHATPLSAVVAQFSVFQMCLVHAPHAPLLAHPVAHLMHLSTNKPPSVAAVTYAEAMTRMIRKVRRRTLETRMRTASRTNLNDSTTDVDDDPQPFKSLRRVFRRRQITV